MSESTIIEDIRKYRVGMQLLLETPEYSIGTTPSEVIYTEDKVKLIHYIPTVKNPYPVPILMVYALVNRYYILDLQPDKSVIKNLLEEGFDVYIIDWGYPSSPERYLTLDDYINGYMDTAVDQLRERLKLDKITLMGICQGGTFSVMYTALHQEKIQNLVSVVTPVNFDTDKGLLNIWAKYLDVDKIVDYYGIVPGNFLNNGFLLTDPFRLMFDKYINIFERIECDHLSNEECTLGNRETVKNFLRMEKWIFDSPDQPGEAYRQFLKDCYQKNLLIKNEMTLDGKKINLKNISVPLLNVMAQYDHLVPNDCSKPLNNAVSSTDKEMLVFPTGHIGIFVGSRSQKEVCPKIAQWLKPRSSIGNGQAGQKTGTTRRSSSARTRNGKGTNNETE